MAGCNQMYILWTNVFTLSWNKVHKKFLFFIFVVWNAYIWVESFTTLPNYLKLVKIWKGDHVSNAWICNTFLLYQLQRVLCQSSLVLLQISYSVFCTLPVLASSAWSCCQSGNWFSKAGTKISSTVCIYWAKFVDPEAGNICETIFRTGQLVVGIGLQNARSVFLALVHVLALTATFLSLLLSHLQC